MARVTWRLMCPRVLVGAQYVMLSLFEDLSLPSNSSNSDREVCSIGPTLRYDTVIPNPNLAHALEACFRHCKTAPNGRGELTSVDSPIRQSEVRSRSAAASHAINGFFEFGYEGTEAVLRNTSFCRISPDKIVHHRSTDHIRITLRPTFAIGG